MRVRRIHESRLVRFYGVKRLRSHTSNRASAENDSQDWGSSVLQRACDSIQGYGDCVVCHYAFACRWGTERNQNQRLASHGVRARWKSGVSKSHACG